MNNFTIKSIPANVFACKKCGKQAKINVFEQDNTGIKTISLICADCELVDIMPYEVYLQSLKSDEK